MSKHTKGPWETTAAKTELGEVQMVRSGLEEIVQIRYADGLKDSDTVKANAKLIAAAPELLDAAFSALDLIKNELGEGEVTESLRTALRKATGAPLGDEAEGK